ncbi:MAG: cobalamin-dependent protein, partial [Candidatus Wallbacteria bacterium]|nr:cobalamin-dependent protein [Candidatus Wallbacteria bacterium]
MKVTFVYGGFENLGVEYLSAVLKRAGHSTALVYSPKLFNDTMLEADFLASAFARTGSIVHRILATKPDLLAFSVVTDDFVWAREIAQRVKKKRPELPVIFGGIHPTSVPELVMECPEVDYACVGEGEEAIVELADALEHGSDPSGIQNIWGRKDCQVFSNPVRPLIQD